MVTHSLTWMLARLQLLVLKLLLLGSRSHHGVLLHHELAHVVKEWLAHLNLHPVLVLELHTQTVLVILMPLARELLNLLVVGLKFRTLGVLFLNLFGFFCFLKNFLINKSHLLLMLNNSHLQFLQLLRMKSHHLLLLLNILLLLLLLLQTLLCIPLPTLSLTLPRLPLAILFGAATAVPPPSVLALRLLHLLFLVHLLIWPSRHLAVALGAWRHAAARRHLA